MKIAVITCYKQNDYVRALSLRTAFGSLENVETIIIRNSHTNFLRLVEVPLKILWLRLRKRPDAYVITFRGYEMLLFLVLSRVGKPIIFDELVNFTEWMVEHRRFKPDGVPYELFQRWNAWLCGHCRFILADTEAHARYSAHLNHLPVERYRSVPVSTDENVFKPIPSEPHKSFTVFYYGHMLPLHGLECVLEAAVQLKDEPHIRFRIVGGKKQKKTERQCAAAVKQGARVDYEAWLPFDELPHAAAEAGLCLGGPFGNTLQSEFVITGKTYQFLAMGRPVLVGHNQVSGLFIDKKNCLAVGRSDASAIADAIRWAYGHQAELDKIGKAGRQLYQKHFSQTVINRQVRQLVDDLSANG